jgi:hypothetical protein
VAIDLSKLLHHLQRALQSSILVVAKRERERGRKRGKFGTSCSHWIKKTRGRVGRKSWSSSPSVVDVVAVAVVITPPIDSLTSIRRFFVAYLLTLSVSSTTSHHQCAKQTPVLALLAAFIVEGKKLRRSHNQGPSSSPLFLAPQTLTSWTPFVALVSPAAS